MMMVVKIFNFEDIYLTRKITLKKWEIEGTEGRIIMRYIL